MSKGSMMKFGVAAVVLGVAGVAAAQSNGPSGFSARLGGFFPRVGDTQLAAGLDYKFNTVPVDPARGGYLSYLGASADFYGRSDNYNVPVALTYNVRANQLVFSGGIGMDFGRDNGRSFSGFGAQLGVAYEFARIEDESANPIFVQAKYFFANDSDMSGLGLFLGVRF